MSQRDPRESALRAFSNDTYLMKIQHDYQEVTPGLLGMGIFCIVLTAVLVVVAFTSDGRVMMTAICVALMTAFAALKCLWAFLAAIYYRIVLRSRRRRDNLIEKRAAGTLEALLEDFDTATPAPGWMGKDLKFGKRYLFARGCLEVEYSKIKEVYAFVLYCKESQYFDNKCQHVSRDGKEYPITGQSIRMKFWQDGQLKCWNILEVPRHLSAQSILERIFPLLQQGNPEIRMTGQVIKELKLEE